MDKPAKKFGFGLMRLPEIEGKDLFDMEQFKDMVDVFMDNGFTYFDTAYVYEDSEAAAKIALVDRYPRDSYTLATKLHAGFVKNEEEAKAEFETSLERSGAGYFDYYLLHALSLENYQLYDEYHLWDFVKGLKEEGKIKNLGFSFHGTPKLLDELLTEHPDVDFVQLQINYADWINPNIASKACYEVARKHDKPIVVMEPVKGGMLANPPAEVKRLLDAANPNASYASWALRFAASLDGVMVVLSGMSSIQQMRENVELMRDFKPLTDAEQDVIREAQKIIAGIDMIPCTGCHYCTGGCPMQIDIPSIFRAMNTIKIYGDEKTAKQRYGMATSRGHGEASDCIGCRQCEGACPQHLKVVKLLEGCANVFD